MGLSHSSDHRALALIVDDDEEEREAYARSLILNGINTAEAEDGLHGIAKAASLLPDVIAADLRTPGEDVLDMCYRLKRQETTKHIPIIGVTENGTLREIDQALRAGCVSVLVKPCLPNVLLAEARRVLALPGLPAA
jgi:CheY-like chemotaxis protein